jgi:hypothetical protein
MPTVMRIGPYRFHFYSRENNEPPHIHVTREEMEAKFWLRPVSGRISIFKQAFGSEGTIENSPAFQCRDRLEKRRVPQGRLKRNAFSNVPPEGVTN